MKPNFGARLERRKGLAVRPYNANPHHPEPGNGQRPPVTRDDWKRRPLPKKTTTIALGHDFSAEEFSRIRQGLVPQKAADQWFIFYEGDVLFVHRSWTGHCIYVVHFDETGDEIRATYADVNRDREQYGETDGQKDRELVLELIHVLLLQRTTPQEV